MVNVNATNLNCVEALSDNEINEFLRCLMDEKDKRQRKKRQMLIDAFYTAVYNLMEAGVSICFVDGFDEYQVESPKDDFVFN